MAFGQLGRAGGAGLSNVGRPRSIIGQAIAGHPNWAGAPTRPQAPPTLGGKTIGQWWGAGAGQPATWTGNPADTVAPTPTTAAPPTAAASPPPPPSPLDALYYSNVAKHDFSTNNEINALGLRDTNNFTNLQTALGNLQYQQPRDQLSLMQRANTGGGLYSSVEGMNQANLVHSYNQRENTAQTTYDQAHSGIATRIAELKAGIPLYDTGEAIASGNRSALQAQNDPTAGANATGPAAPAGSSSGATGHSAAPSRVKPAVGRAGGALLGNLGNLTRPQIGRAGGALSGRPLAKALGARRR